MSEENELYPQSPELHPDVSALDEKLAGADPEKKEAFDALIEERNEAYRLHHAAPQPEAASEA